MSGFLLSTRFQNSGVLFFMGWKFTFKSRRGRDMWGAFARRACRWGNDEARATADCGAVWQTIGWSHLDQVEGNSWIIQSSCDMKILSGSLNNYKGSRSRILYTHWEWKMVIFAFSVASHCETMYCNHHNRELRETTRQSYRIFHRQTFCQDFHWSCLEVQGWCEHHHRAEVNGYGADQVIKQ